MRKFLTIRTIFAIAIIAVISMTLSQVQSGFAAEKAACLDGGIFAQSGSDGANNGLMSLMNDKEKGALHKMKTENKKLYVDAGSVTRDKVNDLGTLSEAGYYKDLVGVAEPPGAAMDVFFLEDPYDVTTALTYDTRAPAILLTQLPINEGNLLKLKDSVQATSNAEFVATLKSGGIDRLQPFSHGFTLGSVGLSTDDLMINGMQGVAVTEAGSFENVV
jgi:hypothetical protein